MAQKQSKRHPDLSPSDYALVQQILSQGKIKKNAPKDGQTAYDFVGYMYIDNKPWKIAFKVIEDKSEIWLTTFHRLKDDQIKLDTDDEIWIRE